MKRFTISFLLIDFMFSISLFAQPSENNPQAQQMLNKASHNFFIENKGQWPKEVRYLTRIGGMNAWITNKGVVYDYYQITRDYKIKETMQMPRQEKEEFERQHTSIKGQVVNIELENSNTEPKTAPSGVQQGYYNYFIGNDSTKWASYVRLYNEVLVQDVYAGIDTKVLF